MPAAVAISAAATFERIPPEPSGDVAEPIDNASSSAGSDTAETSRAVGIHARIGGQQPRRRGQQQQQRRVHQHRDLRREEVVVAEGDLVGGRRVVLVDDRHDPPLDELAQRPARVEVVRARAHVEERQQHLGGLDAALAQVLVVGAVEPPLADRGRRLQLLHRPRAPVEPQQVDAARDRARGDDDDVDAGRVQRRDLLADPRDDRQPQRAGVLGDDRRPELDDRDRHYGRSRNTLDSGGPRPPLPGDLACDRPYLRSRPPQEGSSSKTMPPISTSSPGSNPARSSAPITPIRRSRDSTSACASSFSRSQRAIRRSTESP